MNDCADTELRPSEFAKLLGLKARRTAFILNRLEACGFRFRVDSHGARYVPPALAAAVRNARAEGRPLQALAGDPALREFLSI